MDSVFFQSSSSASVPMHMKSNTAAHELETRSKPQETRKSHGRGIIKSRKHLFLTSLVVAALPGSRAFLANSMPRPAFHPSLTSSDSCKFNSFDSRAKIAVSNKDYISYSRNHAVWMSTTQSPPSWKSRQASSSSSPTRSISPQSKTKSLSLSKFQNAHELEKEIVRLGRSGRTNDALGLYSLLWKQQQQPQESSKTNSKANGSGSGNKNIRPNTRLMNVAIDACARARPPRLQMAFDIFERHTTPRATTDGNKKTGLRPNVFTFGSLMSACARARDATRALDLLESMEKTHQIKPNGVVYSTAMLACQRAHPQPQPHLALQLLHQAIADPTVELTVVAYNTVISALAKAGRWKDAVDMLRCMEDGKSLLENYFHEGKYKSLGTVMLPPPPDEVTYATVMHACQVAGKWEQVLQFAQAAEINEIQLDGLALSTALNACQQLGLADEAFVYLERMKNLGLDEGGKTAADEKVEVSGRGKQQQRRTKGRERSGARQDLRGPDEVAYGMAISACSRAGRWKDGLRLLEEMNQDESIIARRQQQQHQRGANGAKNSCRGGMGACAGSVMAYTAAIDGCAEVGEWKMAFEVLQSMEEQTHVQPNVHTYSAVISACAKACAVSETPEEKRIPLKAALGLLQRMQSNTNKENTNNEIDNDAASVSVEPNIVTYNAAMKACAEGLYVQGAFNLLQQLKTNSNLKPTVVTYGTLMTACERVGDIQGAAKVFRFMKDDGIAPNEFVYGAAMSCCRKVGAAEKTYILISKMIQDGFSPNTATFNTAIFALVEASDEAKDNPELQQDLINKALRLFRLMMKDELISTSRHNSHTGRGKLATQSRSNIHHKPNHMTYSVLIRALATTLQRPHDAEVLLRAMRHKSGLNPPVELYTAVVSSYERNKQPFKALTLLEQMREDGYDFYNVKVLDAAFKKAVNLVHRVTGGSSTSPSPSSSSLEEVGELLVGGDMDQEEEPETGKGL